MRHTNVVGALMVLALPLAAQQTTSVSPPACTVPAVTAPAPPAGMGQCPMMQQGGCPMMQAGQHGPGHGAMEKQGGTGIGAWSEPALAPINDALTFCPSRILGQKDVLELTPQQEVKLEQLLESAQTAIEVAQTEAQRESDALSQSLRLGKPDIRDVERRFRALHAALGTAHLVRLRTSIQARALLTDEQREKMVGPFAMTGGCGADHEHRGGR